VLPSLDLPDLIGSMSSHLTFHAFIKSSFSNCCLLKTTIAVVNDKHKINGGGKYFKAFIPNFTLFPAVKDFILKIG